MTEENRLHNQEDVNPSTQQDKIQEILNEGAEETLPETNGTGANRTVPRAESLIIKEEDEQKEGKSND